VIKLIFGENKMTEMTTADETKMENLIKLQEGVSLKPYTDTTGHMTIGYGHNLNNGISQAVANLIFEEDISAAEHELALNAPWYTQLDDARQAVLINMTFNEGIGGVMAFKDMLRAMQAGQWQAASAALLDSQAARELPSRYQKLSYILETGVL
jgi:lysozyme